MLQAANFTGYHLKRRTRKIFVHHKSNSFHFPTGIINLSLKYDHTIIGLYTLLFNLENQMLGFKLNYSCRRIFLEGKAVHIFHCGRLNPTMLLVAKLLHSWLCFLKVSSVSVSFNTEKKTKEICLDGDCITDQ